MSYPIYHKRYPEEEYSEACIIFGHAVSFLVLVVLVFLIIGIYHVDWYFWVPLCLVLIARPIAYYQMGRSDGHAEGRKHEKRKDLYKSLGTFQPGEELQALRRKHRELSCLYEHSRYVLNEKRKEYHEAYASSNHEAKKIGDDTVVRSGTAFEALGDAVERCDYYNKELDKLRPEMKELEWEEKLEISRKAKETKDVECGMVDASKS